MADASERTTRTSRASFRQHQELRDARHQSAASREILAALGRAVANPGDVLDTVVEYAARLCHASRPAAPPRRRRFPPLAGRRRYPRRLSPIHAGPPHRQEPFVHCRARGRGHAYPSNPRRARGRGLRPPRPTASHRFPHPALDADDPPGRGRRRASLWRTDVAPFDDRERELLEEFAASRVRSCCDRST